MKVLYVAWMILALIVAGCANESGGASPAATIGDSGDAPVGCAEAFGELNAEIVTQAFEEDSDALDRSIAACDSVEEWQTFATELVGDAVPADEQLTFIEGRCRANPELANVNACPDARES